MANSADTLSCIQLKHDAGKKPTITYLFRECCASAPLERMIYDSTYLYTMMHCALYVSNI